jgi:hypothetical protein
MKVQVKKVGHVKVQEKNREEKREKIAMSTKSQNRERERGSCKMELQQINGNN